MNRTHGTVVFQPLRLDRKSTRLNSSHEWISYAVFCLKNKSNDIINILFSSANKIRAIQLILRLVISKILTSRLSLSKHLAHNLGNLLLLLNFCIYPKTPNTNTLPLHFAIPI